MALLTNFGSGTGTLYVVDSDGTSVISSMTNTMSNVKRLLLDASTSIALPPTTGSYATTYGRRYFMNTSGGSQGDLTGATEITKGIVQRGLESELPVTSYTIASGVVTPIRDAIITVVNIETEGSAATDDLDTITTTNYNTGDLIIFRGLVTGHVVTFKNGTGNIFLANAVNFATGAATLSITLQYVSGTGFVEIARTPNIGISASNFRSSGLPFPIAGVAGLVAPTSGTVNLTPGISKGAQVVTGTPALIGSLVYQADPAPVTPYLDGDTISILYRAQPTNVGANAVTIFGATLTTQQAQGLSGTVRVDSIYRLSNTTWYTTVTQDSLGEDFATTASLASYEPVLGNPAASGYVLTSTTGGVRSWQPVLSTGVLYFEGSTVGTPATLTETTLKTYTLPANALNQTNDALYIYASGYTAANANAKTIRLKIGGLIITYNAVVTNPNNDFWTIEGYVYRTGANAARSSFSFVFADNATAAPTIEIYGNTMAPDWTTSNAIIITGQNGVATLNDIQCVSLAVHKVAKQS